MADVLDTTGDRVVVYVPDKEGVSMMLATRMALNAARCQVKKQHLPRMQIVSHKAEETPSHQKVWRFFDDWDQCPGAFFDPSGYYATTLSQLRRPAQRDAYSRDLFELLWKNTGYGACTERYDQRKRSLASKQHAWCSCRDYKASCEMGDLFQWWGYARDGRIGLATHDGGMARHCSFTLPAPDEEFWPHMLPGQIIDLVGFSKFRRLRKAYASALYLMP